MIRDETAIRAAFEPARSLEPTDVEVARVLSRARRKHDRRPAWRRLAPAVALTLMLLIGAGYVAAPPIRAAIDSVTGTFSGWIGGDNGGAPGRPLSASEEAPAYLRDPHFADDPRVIAEADGYKLFVARGQDGGLVFDLGDTGYGVGYTRSDLDFGDHAMFVLGPSAAGGHADEHGHVPLFGITARSVKSVELTYQSGPPLRVKGVDGGFVLLAEPTRRPHEVIVFDAQGGELERQAIDASAHDGPRINWSLYGPPAPRVPSRCMAGAVGSTPPKDCPNHTP
jgi:hypothetical protein